MTAAALARYRYAPPTVGLVSIVVAIAVVEMLIRIGLINRVVDSGAEREEALVFARKIAKKSSHIIKIGKEGFYQQAEMSLADAYRFASEVMVEILMASDAEEGLKAFIDKREPKCVDRK